MRRAYLLAMVGSLALLGCGAKERSAPSSESGPPARLAPPPGSAKGDALALAAQKPVGAKADGEAKAAEAEEPPTRKIVYNGEVGVVVSSFDEAADKLRQLIKKTKGFMAQAEITGSAGQPRSGHWRIRVPAEQFDTFMDEVVKLGVPEKNSQDTRDVTTEYYDLEAEIKNKKAEEDRLRRHLDTATGKLEEILTIEKELSRVRGQINQLEGRQRVLAGLAALSTVNVTLREIKDYVPPQAPQPPTFGEKIAGTFSGSFDALVKLGQVLTIVAVALAPWLPVIGLVVAAVWLEMRRRRVKQLQTGR
jgi:hypothetical protein